MPFWDECTEWPQNDRKHYKVKEAYVYSTTTPASQISSIFAVEPANHFRITGNFETSALNGGLRVTLNTMSSQVTD